MLKYVTACLVALAVTLPATAAAKSPCYGPKEEALARNLLEVMPGYRSKLNADWIRQLRTQICTGNNGKGQIGNVDAFYHDPNWRPVVVAAEARGLDALPVLAAMVRLNERTRHT